MDNIVIKLEEPTLRSPLTQAMFKRHPRTKVFRDKRQRRAKDARKHWSRDEE